MIRSFSRWMSTTAFRRGLMIWLRLGVAMAVLSPGVFAASSARSEVGPKPNVVVILADDLGLGDVACMNPDGRIATPNLDRLGAGGMRFFDAHSSSAVCTPTRYGLLTGRYNWRSRLQRGVQGGMSPPLIEPGRITLAGFLRENGYHTACIGKWHLGLAWALKPGVPPFGDTIEAGPDGWRVDFTRPIQNGPTHQGFDFFHGIAASLDMVPYTFIRNDRVVEVPTVDARFPMTRGSTNAFTRRGPAAAGFTAEGVLPTLTAEAVNYIHQRSAESRRGRPFFLYLPLTSPHTPVAPNPAWRGRSGINAYADFVMETDHAVGEVLRALEITRTAGNTLVVFASDNGCSPEARLPELRARGHDPSAGFRGAKADLFEGGHRVPMLVRWPGRVQPGSVSRALVCLNDVFATVAEALGKPVPPGAAEDSVSFLGVLTGAAPEGDRTSLVHHSINGSFAIRQGRWKLLLAADSGGWSEPRPGTPQAQAAGVGSVQLYNLESDPAESRNLAAAYPGTVAHLKRQLEALVSAGKTRSSPASGDVRR